MSDQTNITPFQKTRQPSKAMQAALNAVTSNSNPSPEEQIYLGQTAALLSTMMLPIAQLSMNLALDGYLELSNEINNLVLQGEKVVKKLSSAAGVPSNTSTPPTEAA